MNSSPDNFSPADDNRDRQSLDNLIDLLLNADVSQDKDSEELTKREKSYEENDRELDALTAISESDARAENFDATVESLNSNGLPYPDLEVEVEEPEKKITLEEAVEYEAFLRQKADEEPNSEEETDLVPQAGLEKYEAALDLDPESASTEELVESVNILIPLIVELLKYKIEDDREAILAAVTPVVEKLIERRSVEEPQKMALAIAQILPSAIAEKIQLSPEEIAKAIAPELALAIKEQIRLDEDAISEALGSEMGKAIKTQIEVEKDAMVDALYPVIGDTISKYMVEVVQEINQKVENTLSPEGFKRKIRARMKGVSEAELILQESIGCHVQAIFLIDKDSGIIIQEVQQPGELKLDSDLLAGMLTAIRSFANDCIVSGSELDTIDYGNWQIHLEVAGYCYLAVVLKGDPHKSFIERIRHTFGEIILKHGKAIEKFEGDLATVPPAIQPELEKLIQPEATTEGKSGSPTALLWLLAFILAVILIPWGMTSYRSHLARNVEKVTAIELDAAPELSVYRLEPQVKQKTLILQGRVPSQNLRDRAAEITQAIAQKNNLQFDNRIITVNLPVNPDGVAGEIQRLTELFAGRDGVWLETNYQGGRLSLTGFVLDEEERKSLVKVFSSIPGIEQTVVNLRDSLPKLEERIYFSQGSAQLDIDENSSKIRYIKQFLSRYPNLHLKLVAYSDRSGSPQLNRQLSRKRCQNVRDTLIDFQTDADRVIIDCDRHRFSKESNGATSPSNRYVLFEPFIPMK